MKDYEIEYELNSIMECITGVAGEKLDGYDRDEVVISIDSKRIESLESSGVEDGYSYLEELMSNNGFDCFNTCSENGKSIVVMGCNDLNLYRKLILTYYKFCKKVALMKDKIIIGFERNDTVVINLPILSLLQVDNKIANKESILLLNILQSKMCELFGDESFDSVGLRNDREMSSKKLETYIIIDFIDRDDYLKDETDINSLYNMVIDSSIEALNVIFKNYLKG